MKMQNVDCMRSMMSQHRQRLALDQVVSTDNLVPSVHALRQHGHTTWPDNMAIPNRLVSPLKSKHLYI